MKPTDKIRVAVLYGGRSAEHEVSLRSASNVIQNLDPTIFDVIPLGIDKDGKWFLGKDMYAKSLENKSIPQVEGDVNTWFTPEWVGKSVANYQNQELKASSQSASFDVVFPVVHGTLCEDGTLQGLLELAGLPYVGCGVLSSAMGMDKDVSKRLALHAGIPTAPYFVIKHEQWLNQRDKCYEQAEKLNYPLFIKPANTGSSIGINKAKSAEQLAGFIEEAFRFDTKILVEKALNITELEVAVLESPTSVDEPIVSVVGEIKPRHEFYSYDAKYVDENGAELLIPAPISEELHLKAQQMAKDLFKVLECEGMARVDLFLEKETQQLYFNEINTIPGFTQISMYPKLMQATGISYQDLLTRLIKLALKRHKNKSSLIRSYE